MTHGQWGRSIHPSPIDKIYVITLLIGAPLCALFLTIANIDYNGSLAKAFNGLFSGDIISLIPSLDFNHVFYLTCFLIFQFILALIPDYFSKFLPNYRGEKQQGQKTPADHEHYYNINGLQAWWITFQLFFWTSYFGYIDPAWIANNWKELFLAANVLGFAVSFLAHAKALISPTHPDDDKYADCWYYNFFMGIEFNPRIFDIDIKLFSNGRTGIMAWTLINYSFAAYQYQNYGFVSNSMILVNLLHLLYILDFYWNEAWYLKTIDIAHDHYGWQLSWGTFVWLPFTYTLQGAFLMNNPNILTPNQFWVILILGVIGYTIFRWTNYQKDYFRRTDLDKCIIWGQKAKYIECTYTTKCGTSHKSKLLTSGWWGLARHMNYTGDIILSTMYCCATGTTELLPYFYAFFMTTLLVTRCIRDEDRCFNKYKDDWIRYCKEVPYRLIPGFF